MRSAWVRLSGTLFLASLSGSRNKGLLMVSLLVLFGMALVLFSRSDYLYLSLLSLLLVGVGSMGYNA